MGATFSIIQYMKNLLVSGWPGHHSSDSSSLVLHRHDVVFLTAVNQGCVTALLPSGRQNWYWDPAEPQNFILDKGTVSTEEAHANVRKGKGQQLC